LNEGITWSNIFVRSGLAGTSIGRDWRLWMPQKLRCKFSAANYSVSSFLRSFFSLLVIAWTTFASGLHFFCRQSRQSADHSELSRRLWKLCKWTLILTSCGQSPSREMLCVIGLQRSKPMFVKKTKSRSFLRRYPGSAESRKISPRLPSKI
jgi:hypothetical protein